MRNWLDQDGLQAHLPRTVWVSFIDLRRLGLEMYSPIPWLGALDLWSRAGELSV